jgi:hypothetical protein
MNNVVFYYRNRLRCQCGTALALGIQLLASAAVAQDAVPTEMLQRTFPIQAADTGAPTSNLKVHRRPEPVVE